MKFLEKNLEEIIFNNYEKIQSRGLSCCRHDHMLRQVPLGSYGTADLIGIKHAWDMEQGLKGIFITVYELKQEKIDVSALMQAFRYVHAIEKFIEKEIDLSNHAISFKVCLVGSSIQLNGDFALMMNNVHNASVYLYEYGFDGIHFTHAHGYTQTEEKLPKVKRSFIRSLSPLTPITNPVLEDNPF